MTVQEAMQTLQNAPLEERIQIMELLLQSLKHDLTKQQANTKKERKPFVVKTFDLGEDISVDREALYLSRGL
ncbi:MAG: hypothetical protein KDE51_15935 [Anaerolineales bacterium]|nr:hypothetical protein [Anaerolineales bacterium]